MKQLNTYLKLAAFLLLMSISGRIFSQVVVPEKPFPPRAKIKFPSKPGPEYLLLPGRWVWHRPSQMYVWLGPVWVVPPRGKTWNPGYWKQVDNGWLWVPGKWQRKTGFLQRKNKSLST